MARRLAAAILPSGARLTETYRFDDLRVAQQTSSGIQTFTWSGGEVLAQQGRTSGGVSWTELFTRAPFDGNSLIRATGTISTGASVHRQYHGDLLGTTEGLSDGTQSLVASYDTSAWGVVNSGSATDQPYVFVGGQGYWYEPALALHYVRARWLNPATGSWLSPDPVPTEPRYRYAANAPTYRVDPSGTQSGGPEQFEGGGSEPTEKPNQTSSPRKRRIRARSPYQSIIDAERRRINKAEIARRQLEMEAADPAMTGVGAAWFSFWTGIPNPRESDHSEFSVTFVEGVHRSNHDIDVAIHQRSEEMVRRPLKSVHHNRSFLSILLKSEPFASRFIKPIEKKAQQNHVAFLLPPLPGTDEFTDYVTGVAYGLADTIFSTLILLPLNLAQQILSVCEFVATTQNFWEDILGAAKAYVHEIDVANKRDPFTRGKTVGRLIVDIVPGVPHG